VLLDGQGYTLGRLDIQFIYVDFEESFLLAVFCVDLRFDVPRLFGVILHLNFEGLRLSDVGVEF